MNHNHGDPKYTHKNPAVHPEDTYLRLVRDVIDMGKRRNDRTGTGTLSLFGTQSRYDISNGTIPLLTTKQVFVRSIIEELLWFIKGSTNSKELSSKNVKIWDANGSRAFLERSGFKDREEGDLGPVYGFQWRHFGATYETCRSDYTGRGVDQLGNLIEQIKANPSSRRLILCAWNAADLPSMALPPCHCLAQFYVHKGAQSETTSVRPKLSCQLYQRSGDLGLGVPFNIASYAILTHMIAHVTGMQAGELVHVLGDAHVYLNHVDALEEQLKRTPVDPFPTLHFKRDVKDIDDFTYDDFEIRNYKHQGKITMKMAV
jgi:thymidylate synthase